MNEFAELRPTTIIAIVLMNLLFVFLVFDMIKLKKMKKRNDILKKNRSSYPQTNKNYTEHVIGRQKDIPRHHFSMVSEKNKSVPDNLINSPIYSNFDTPEKEQCNNDMANESGNHSNTGVSSPSSNSYSFGDSGGSSYSDSGSSGGCD